MLRKVAILCAARNSVYHDIPGLDVFDKRRDARTFDWSSPAVGHPPCRSFSVYTRQQAKPEPGEAALGLWVARGIRNYGGVLEQPAKSLLFQQAGLPLPGHPESPLSWSIEVHQSWWGYSMRKATWLYFRGVTMDDIRVPFRLHVPGYDRRREQVMSHNQRAATCLEFAKWLVEAARKVRL